VPLLKRAYDRALGMAKDGVVSASALDDAEKNYEMSLNKQNVAKAQMTVLKAKIAPVGSAGGAGSSQPEATRGAAQLHRCGFAD